jgi:polyferredoxin
MSKKTTQSIMVWFLPLVIIGGLFVPILGYLVFFMMSFFLTLSYFKGRLWCSYLCPRGAFLDLVLSRFSLKRQFPTLLISQKFKWVVFIIFIIFFISQLILAKKDLYSIGFIFVRMCLITTLISIFMGVPTRERAWCVICPMGTLQTEIGSLGSRLAKNK